jgi:MoaA/NifB/PqqE/SkfB family radical SAM enzyme
MIIVWRVVDSCNLSCPFCAYDKRLDVARHQADPAQVVRFLDKLAAWRAAGEPVLLSWLGGEPLLWPELDALTRRAHAAGIALSVTTNGTTLNSPLSRRHLLDHYSEVTISIDGFGDFHDAMRGWKGAFAKLQAGTQALIAEREATGSLLKIRVNVVLMRDNMSQFSELCRELASWGVDEICFNQLGGRDRPEFWPAHRLRREDIDDLRVLLPRLRLALGATRLIGGDAYLDRIEGTTLDHRLPVSDCRVSESFLFVDEAGRISPCSFTPHHFARSVDDIGDDWPLETLGAWFRRQQGLMPAPDCANCPSTQQFDKWAEV